MSRVVSLVWQLFSSDATRLRMSLYKSTDGVRTGTTSATAQLCILPETSQQRNNAISSLYVLPLSSHGQCHWRLPYHFYYAVRASRGEGANDSRPASFASDLTIYGEWDLVSCNLQIF